MSPIIVSPAPGGPVGVSSGTVIQTGVVSPAGVVTPTHKGALYQDLTAGALYLAVGATSADWVAISGPADVTLPGFYVYDGYVYQVAAAGAQALITDVNGQNIGSTGVGLYWNYVAGINGAQNFYLILGTTAQFTHKWEADGSYIFPAALTGASWGVLPDGAEYLKAISTPADGDVATGQRIQWYDSTTGAPRLRFKTKDAAGTLTSGISASLGMISPVGIITSGALPTLSPASGTALQVSTTRDAETVTSLATDGTANAATCTVALSADNVTFSTLVVVTASAAVNTVGSITIPVNVRVPAGWWLKLTTSHATLGTLTYY